MSLPEEGPLVTGHDDREPYDIDRDYRARVPFMSVGALVFGGGAALWGFQFVLDFGWGPAAFAIFGVAVVVFCLSIGAMLGALVGQIVYEIASRVAAAVRGSGPGNRRDGRGPGADSHGVGDVVLESPSIGSPMLDADLAAELAFFTADLALRQARGEMPPPNPESSVPYALVASQWLDAKAETRVLPDYREAIAGDNDLRFAHLKECWSTIVKEASAYPPVKPLITRAIPIAVSGNVVVIGYNVQDAFLRDQAERRQGQILDIVGRVLGSPVGALVFQIVPSTEDYADNR